MNLMSAADQKLFATLVTFHVENLAGKKVASSACVHCDAVDSNQKTASHANAPPAGPWLDACPTTE